MIFLYIIPYIIGGCKDKFYLSHAPHIMPERGVLCGVAAKYQRKTKQHHLGSLYASAVFRRRSVFYCKAPRLSAFWLQDMVEKYRCISFSLKRYKEQSGKYFAFSGYGDSSCRVGRHRKYCRRCKCNCSGRCGCSFLDVYRFFFRHGNCFCRTCPWR